MFGRKCSIIGAIHVHALPGAAGFCGSVDRVLEAALADARAYKNGGVDGVIVENMHDVPYFKGFVHPETTAAMAVITREIKREIELPTGIQILAGANMEALGAAVAANADFLRVEGFVYAHVADEGIHESCAAALIRKRAELRADHIRIFADIKKKHSAHAITSDVDIAQTAHDAEFFRADGVIVTGACTGTACDVDELKAVRNKVRCSVLVGSGVNAENINLFAKHADALIVGSSLKRDGIWTNEVDYTRVTALTRECEIASS